MPPFFGVVEQPDGTLLSPFFEGDVIEAALSLDVSTDTVAVFGNYGLTDRWDVGLAIPFVRVDMDARVLATIRRLATAANPLIHTFQAGVDVPTQTFSTSASASGLGDIALRTKYRLANFRSGGLAAALDVRLPTGDEENLLGGSTQVKLFLIESAGSDRLTQHINVGYTISSNSNGQSPTAIGLADFPDELNYAAGLEFVLEPRITVIGDIVGPQPARRRPAESREQDVSIPAAGHASAAGRLDAIRRVRTEGGQPQSSVRHRRREGEPQGQFPDLGKRPLSVDRLGAEEPADDDCGDGLCVLKALGSRL